MPGIDFDHWRREIYLPGVVEGDVALRGKNPHLFRGPCPLHGGRNANFLVWRSKRDGSWKFRCYSKCQERGDVFDYTRLKYGWKPRETLERLAGAPRSAPLADNWAERIDERPQVEPLSWDRVERYTRLLDLPIDPTGRDQLTPRQWWRGRGLDDPTIGRFLLGWCPNCPTAFDPGDRKRRHPSATIPVWHTEADTGEQVLLDVRHRLLGAKGSKYRPDKADRGYHLFNRNNLHFLCAGDDLVERRERDVCLVVEGEIKAMVLCALGLDARWAVVSGCGGAGVWLGQYGGWWRPELEAAGYRRYVYLLDPGMETVAEQAAAYHGRYGAVVRLGEKVDDWLLGLPGEDTSTEGVQARTARLIDLVEHAGHTRERSYWAARMARGD